MLTRTNMGSARGLLGKRPLELDSDDDNEDRDGIKRLKGHQSSPVKNVRLHAPPSKAETTGRLTRANRRSLEDWKAFGSIFNSSNRLAGWTNYHRHRSARDWIVWNYAGRPNPLSDYYYTFTNSNILKYLLAANVASHRLAK